LLTWHFCLLLSPLLLQLQGALALLLLCLFSFQQFWWQLRAAQQLDVPLTKPADSCEQ
jgi:hypothetical protein